MIIAVSPENPVRLLPVEGSSSQICRQNHQICADSGWKIIHDIIQLRRCSSEEKIPIVLITDHRVHRVDCLVSKAQDWPAESCVQHGGDHAIRCILRHRLHGRLRHADFVQRIRIAARQSRDRFSSCFQSFVLQAVINLHTLIPKTLCGKNLVGHHRFNRKPQPGMNPVGSEQDQRCGQNGRRQYQQYKKRTAYSISVIMYVVFFVVFRLSVLFSGMALLRRSSASEIQLSLQRRDQIPDQAEGAAASGDLRTEDPGRSLQRMLLYD